MNGGHARTAAAKCRNELKLLIAKAFEDSDGTYGYRRVPLQLARWGVRAERELVRALMRELGLVACQPRPWRPSTTQQGQAGPIPDLVAPRFQRGYAWGENGWKTKVADLRQGREGLDFLGCHFHARMPRQIARALGIRPGEAARLVRVAAAGAQAEAPGTRWPAAGSAQGGALA